jgi:hypothetical protein
MRNYRNALAALVFMLALSAPAFGDDGVIHTGNPDPTSPPPAASTTQDTASDGIMSTGEAAPVPQPTDDLTGVALGLLQTLALI